MEEHAVHQKCLHVLQDGLVTIVNKVRRNVGMSNIYLMIIFKTSMSIMVIMSVIMPASTLLDLLYVHVMMGICYNLMKGLVKVHEGIGEMWTSNTTRTAFPICTTNHNRVNVVGIIIVE